MAHSVARPNLMVNPGMLWIGALGTTDPTNTVTAGVFSDDPAVAWIPLGPTTDGASLSYQVNVEPVTPAEFLDPVQYFTTGRSGSIAFALMDFTLSNYQRAMNAGIAKLTNTGTSGSELTTIEPPDPGAEVRAMLLWESTDRTVRLRIKQCIQGGEIQTDFKKAPDAAAIPCTFNMEIPTGSTKPFTLWGAGTTRI